MITSAQRPSVQPYTGQARGTCSNRIDLVEITNVHGIPVSGGEAATREAEDFGVGFRVPAVGGDDHRLETIRDTGPCQLLPLFEAIAVRDNTERVRGEGREAGEDVGKQRPGSLIGAEVVLEKV